MDRKLDVEMTTRLILWSIFYQVRAILFFAVPMIFAIMWDVLVELWKGAPFQWDFLIAPIIFMGLITLIPIQSYRRTRAQIKKLKASVIHFHFTDDGLNIDTDLSSGQNKWEVFKGIRKYGKVWKIVVPSGLAFVLPTEQLDDELKGFLVAKLTSLSKPLWKKVIAAFAIWLLLFLVIFYLTTNRHY